MVIYTIVSGNIGAAFEISNTGFISLSAFLDYETIASYTLKIEVRDVSDNKASNDFTISVRDTSFQLLNTYNISDNGTLELDEARGVTVAVISETAYLFVAREIDDGISVFSINSDGTLTSADNIKKNPSLNLDGTVSVATAVISGTTYLLTIFPVRFVYAIFYNIFASFTFEAF